MRPRFAVLWCCVALGLTATAAAEQRIVIHKAERRLELLSDGAKAQTYRVGLGPNPIGHKTQQGDGRTPEGVYYVCVKNPRSQFYLSLGLSYPGPADAARGLAHKRISKLQHDSIVAAHRKRTTPPWNTELGGEIFIHGKGSSSDWTLGCIALDDADMKVLFTLVATGTPVEIRP